MPSDPLNGANTHRGYSGYQSSFANLIHKVNIQGDDDRGSLLVRGPQEGFSDEEITHIRQVTGYVRCLGTKYGNPATSSGALIETNGQIITVAHALIDEQGRFREPLSKCYFQNQTVPWTKVYLDPQHFKVGTHDPNGAENDRRSDFAIIKLKGEIPNVEPLEANVDPIQEGETVYGIVALQNDMRGRVRPTEPIMMKCSVSAVDDATGSHPTNFNNTCDMHPGGSGGVNLARVNGRLVIKGIFVRTGDVRNDFQPYNPVADSSTFSIGVDGAVVDQAVDLAGGHAVPARRKSSR